MFFHMLLHFSFFALTLHFLVAGYEASTDCPDR